MEFQRYNGENQMLKYMHSKGRTDRQPFYDMDITTFNRLLNTFSWMYEYNSPFACLDNIPTKPTDVEMKEAIAIIKTSGEELLIYAKEHKKGDSRTRFIKMAKKQIECSDYYNKLIADGFFIDKQLKLK